MKHHDTPRYSLFFSIKKYPNLNTGVSSTACFLYPQDFGVGSLKKNQHPKWWVHGNSTIQLKQIIRYGLLCTSRSKQPLCDLCATTTSALKVGVMTVHNILFLAFLQKLNLCLPFLLPPVPHGTSASSWWNLHPFSIVRKHGQSPWGSHNWTVNGSHVLKIVRNAEMLPSSTFLVAQSTETIRIPLGMSNIVQLETKKKSIDSHRSIKPTETTKCTANIGPLFIPHHPACPSLSNGPPAVSRLGSPCMASATKSSSSRSASFGQVWKLWWFGDCGAPSCTNITVAFLGFSLNKEPLLSSFM